MLECRGCGAELDRTNVFIDLGNKPLANALLTEQQLNQPEIHYPLRALVCGRCFLVQLPTAPDPQTLFTSDYPFYAGQSSAWVDHCYRLAALLNTRHNLGAKDSHVLEIGSNDGTMLEPFQRLGLEVTGVEPCHEVAEAAKAKGIPTWEWFWGVESAGIFADKGYRADLVLATNVLAHVPDPRSFLGGIRMVLAKKGVAVIEVPYVADTIAEGRWDQVYHEHYCYFSLLSLSRLARKALLHVTDVEHVPVHGGSLRVTLSHLGYHTPNERVYEMLAAEYAVGLEDLKTYTRFRHEPIKSRRDWWQHRPQGPICGYGASAKAAVWCNYVGLRAGDLRYIVDTTPAKQGKYQPGTHIPIVHPDYARQENIATVVNFCWNWREESEANIRKLWPDATIVYPGELAKLRVAA